MIPVLSSGSVIGRPAGEMKEAASRVTRRAQEAKQAILLFERWPRMEKKKSLYRSVPSSIVIGAVSCLGAVNCLASTILTATGTSCNNGTSTCVTITGGRLAAGESVSVTFVDSTTGKPTTKSAGTLDAGGAATITINAKPGSATPIIASDTTEGTVAPGIVADAFTPGSNDVVSVFAISAGSLSVGGSAFALNGTFTAVATDVVYDSTSAAFGNESGFGTNINIQAVGAGGTIAINSLFSGPYTMNLASLWNSSLPDSIPFTFPLNGTLFLNSSATPFTGLFAGTDTFFFDGSDTVTGNVSLTTDFGVITGTLTATANPQLVPVPELGTLGMLLIGGPVLTAVRGKARRAILRVILTMST